MRITMVCSVALSLLLCIGLVGCSGDNGTSVGNDAKAIGDKLKAEIEKNPADLMKAAEKFKTETAAIKTRYDKLSADEKKKAEVIWPGLKEGK
jgi:hypothetical protein